MHIGTVHIRKRFQYLDHCIRDLVRLGQCLGAINVDVQIHHQTRPNVIGHDVMHPDHAGDALSRGDERFDFLPPGAASGEKAEVLTTGDKSVAKDPQSHEQTRDRIGQGMDQI